MRKVPFNTTAATATPQADAPQKVESVNLIDRLKPKAQLNSSADEPVTDTKSSARGVYPDPPKPKEGEEATATVDENAATEPKADGSTEPDTKAEAAPSATFEDTKQIVEKKLGEFVENPEEVAMMMVRYYNIGRTFILPTLYTKILFPGQELDDVKAVAEKAIENEKKEGVKVTEGFNPYEKRLYAKWQKRDTAMQNLSFSDEDIKWLAKILAKRVKDVGVAAWMEKYDWIIALGYLELKYAAPVIAVRVNDSFEKKFAA